MGLLNPFWQRMLAGFLLLMLVAAWVFWRVEQQTPQEVPVPCADIVAGCSVPDADVRVRFDQAPQPLRHFELQVDWAGVPEVHARFSMRGMEMGLNRYRLLPQGEGRWIAQVMLPACVQGRRDWVVQIESGDTRYALPFQAN